MLKRYKKDLSSSSIILGFDNEIKFCGFYIVEIQMFNFNLFYFL